MRGTVHGLGTPHPLIQLLPAVYQDDGFTNRFTAGLDDVLAPVLSTLDCLDAYVDPALAPADFVDWLSSWVGIPLDENTPLERRRTLVAHAVRLHRMRGTMAGLRAQVELLTGGQVDMSDSGGVAWSTAPGGALPGADTPRLAVRVRVADPAQVPAGLLDAVVTWAKPAHVVHRVEVVGNDRVS